MNIEDIKERVKEEFYIKRDIDFYEAQEDISYLLSIIEIADRALDHSIKIVGDYKQEAETPEAYKRAEKCIAEISQALKAIRKGD